MCEDLDGVYAVAYRFRGVKNSAILLAHKGKYEVLTSLRKKKNEYNEITIKYWLCYGDKKCNTTIHGTAQGQWPNVKPPLCAERPTFSMSTDYKCVSE